MKRVIISGLTASLICTGASWARLYDIDISPAAGAALNPANYASGDYALGIAAPNAVIATSSLATGGEFGSGITYDDVSNILSYDFAYGLAFGFVKLQGNYTTSHIHGPSAIAFPTNSGGSPVAGQDIAADLTQSGTQSGCYTGTWTLDTQA